MITEDEVKAFFGKVGKQYEGSRYNYIRHLRGINIKKELGEGSVLDIGVNCGHLAAEYLISQRFVGIDISYNCLLEARLMVKGTAVNASALNLPIKDSIFDYVVCSEVLYYLHDANILLQEAFRVLKAGGKLIVVSSNQMYFKLGKQLGSLLGLVPKDINERTFYPGQIVRMLKQNRFKYVKVRGYGVIPFKGFRFLDRTFLEKMAIGQISTAIKPYDSSSTILEGIK